MNQAKAVWELVKNDRVSAPGESAGLSAAQDVLVKAHDVVSNVFQVVTAPLSKNQFAVVHRDSPIAATREAISSTLQARWFGEGNPLNLVAKAATGIAQVPDAMISDGLHIGDNGNGLVIKTIA